jgi:hypothetical protein
LLLAPLLPACSLLDASGRGNDHARSAMALDTIKETI